MSNIDILIQKISNHDTSTQFLKDLTSFMTEAVRLNDISKFKYIIKRLRSSNVEKYKDYLVKLYNNSPKVIEPYKNIIKTDGGVSIDTTPKKKNKSFKKN